MTFGEALERLKRGEGVSRSGWNGVGMWIALQEPDEGSANKRPYIYMIRVDRQRVPWVASQTDLLADDWERCPLPQSKGT
jgi:hypothetical protein